jgi:hypothetical protein
LLDLADAFSGYSILSCKVFKSCWLLGQPTSNQYLPFTWVKRADRGAKNLMPIMCLLLVGQLNFLSIRRVGEPIQHLVGRVLLMNRHIQGNVAPHPTVHFDDIAFSDAKAFGDYLHLLWSQIAILQFCYRALCPSQFEEQFFLAAAGADLYK